MYGKHFSSMYDGSMVGSGALSFAMMGYVIANYRPDAVVGAQVRLNPILLAATFGEPVAAVEKAIEYLCSPDPKSTTKVSEGRRLIKIGEFEYQVVNGAKYTAIKNVEEQREQARLRKQKERSENPKLKKGKPLKNEVKAVEAMKDGNVELADKLAEPVSTIVHLEGSVPCVEEEKSPIDNL